MGHAYSSVGRICKFLRDWKISFFSFLSEDGFQRYISSYHKYVFLSMLL